MAETSLLRACYQGNVVEVRRLLPELLFDDLADVVDTRKFSDKETLLHFSCRHGWLDVTKMLVEQYRCDPKSGDRRGDTPLHVACREGHVDTARYLISERGCSTACQNKSGNTPLYLACREGHVDTLKYLVSEQECNTSCQNRWGDTPLHEACRNKHLAAVEILLTGEGSSAACKSKGKHGETLLHYSCLHGWLDITRRLVEQYHCDPESTDQWNCDTPLHVACSEDHLDIVKYLVGEVGCNGTLRNKWGNTPLHVAFHGGYTEIIRYLVKERGYSTVCHSSDSYTPLHEACRKGHLDMVKVLTSGRDCNTVCNHQNRDLDTPLHVACREGHVDIVRYLVGERGCSIACQNQWGDSPLHEVCRGYSEGHVDIVKYLVGESGCSTACQNKYGNTPLHEVCRKGYVDIVRYLVFEQGCNTSRKNKWGDTPLHEACRNGHKVMVEILLTGKDCSVACKSKGDHGETPLHSSCRHGWLDITRRLVEEYHCDPEITDEWNGDTPLHIACHKGHVDIVRYLVIETECSTSCKNKKGNTPLHEACRCNRIDTVQFLLCTGRVDPWSENFNNRTPLQMTEDYEILKMFAGFAGLTKKNLPRSIKVFIFGNPSTGKSTLVKVIENKVTSWLGTFGGQFRNVSGVEPKTAGINTVTIQSSRLGSLAVYDLAGQPEYYSSHDTMIQNLMSSSAVIFIAVVKLSESEAEVIQKLRYWISFIANLSSRAKVTAHLMVVGSWADKVKEAGENIDQKWSSIKKACISSTSPLHFVGFTSLDCRKLASSGLDKICGMMESSCAALREVAKQTEVIYPHLLHAFINTKLCTKVACSVKELCAHIEAEQDSILPTEPSLLSPLLNGLSDGGHLLYLCNKEGFEKGWIVTDEQAILSKINGTIFAPEYFKQHHDIATSTGVVSQSKIAGVFAEYNIDMILCFLTEFEFCQKIKDPFNLRQITSSDPSRNNSASGMTATGESSESYYYFPALVQVEHPTEVWQSSGPVKYQCGWCLQCSKEGQYLTPRFLHVLLLRIAFTFALPPISSQLDKISPVLRRRCVVWKNGIQWVNRDGVETRVEVVEQSQTVLLQMCCPDKQAMACVELRSSLVFMILNCLRELCPAVDTRESLIDLSHLCQHQLGSTRDLITYEITDIANAVQEGKSFEPDPTGRKAFDLEAALYFEPYFGLQRMVLNRLFCKYCARDEVSESFLHDLAGSLCQDMKERVPLATLLKVLKVQPGYIQSVCEQFPEERDNHVRRYFRVLVAWKDNFDTGGGTYQSLRTTLDKYSIFCGRNPLVNMCIVYHGFVIQHKSCLPLIHQSCCNQLPDTSLPQIVLQNGSLAVMA